MNLHTSALGALILVALVAAPIACQTPCSTLTVTGTVNPGQTVTIDVTGATPESITILAIAKDPGSTTLNFGPFGTLVLDLDSPFIPLPIGFTDAAGDLTWAVSIPANASPNAFQTADAYLQAVTVDVTRPGGGMPGMPPMGPFLPTLSFCVSNVATLHIGM
jgi:hypothetical protein